MKLFCFLLTGVFLVSFSGAVSSSTTSLRNKKKKKHKPVPPPPNKKTYVGSVVTLSHVHEDVPEFDPRLFTKTFVGAFNDVFKGSRFTLEDGFISKEFVVPEDDPEDQGDENYESLVRRRNPFAGYSSHTFMTWWWGGWNYYPDADDDDTWWSDDQRMGADMMMRHLSSASAAKHKAFEAELCKRLTMTGDESVAELTHCSIEFTYSAATMVKAGSLVDSFTKPEPAFVTETTTGTLHCHLDIGHVLGSVFNQAENDITGDIFRNSYNLIHSGKGHKITKVEFLRRVDLSEDPDSTGPNDYYNRIWWIKAEYECQGCNHLPPADTDSFYFTLDQSLHKAFEDLVCLKLKTSGLPTYHSSRDCDIAFILQDGVSDLLPLM